MAITREAFRNKRCRRRQRHRKINRWKKLKKSTDTRIDLESMFEEQMYELNSNVLHLKLYIKKMMYEYIGETRDEIAVFYAMALQLHNRTNYDYCSIMHGSMKAITVDIYKYREEYEGILDLCGISAEEIYDNMFGEKDDGYENPREPAAPETPEAPKP